MYKYKQVKTTTLQSNQSYVAEPIELKMKRILANREPIPADVKLIYTSKSDGVKPEFDIRPIS